MMKADFWKSLAVCVACVLIVLLVPPAIVIYGKYMAKLLLFLGIG